MGGYDVETEQTGNRHTNRAVLVASYACGVRQKGSRVLRRRLLSALQTAPPLLDIDVAGLLTSDQVGNALGVGVGAAQVIEEGTFGAVFFGGLHVLCRNQPAEMRCGEV